MLRGEAVHAYDRAIAIQPLGFTYFIHRRMAWVEQGTLDEAVCFCRVPYMERPNQRVSPRWGIIRREACIRLPLHGLRSRHNRPPPCPRDAQERPSETRHHRTHPLNGQHVYTLPSAETVPLAIRERQSGRQSGGERQSGRLLTEPPAIYATFAHLPRTQ